MEARLPWAGHEPRDDCWFRGKAEAMALSGVPDLAAQARSARVSTRRRDSNPRPSGYEPETLRSVRLGGARFQAVFARSRSAGICGAPCPFLAPMKPPRPSWRNWRRASARRALWLSRADRWLLSREAQRERRARRRLMDPTALDMSHQWVSSASGLSSCAGEEMPHRVNRC
jgi:hypothetical protein